MSVAPRDKFRVPIYRHYVPYACVLHQPISLHISSSGEGSGDPIPLDPVVERGH